jgi:hypothetical protein
MISFISLMAISFPIETVWLVLLLTGFLLPLCLQRIWHARTLSDILREISGVQIFMHRVYIFLTFCKTLAGPCEPGTVIYAPFPGFDARVQATVLTQIIDGTFIVQWTGSPDLCTDPSNRAKCVIPADQAYNSQACHQS